MVNLTPYRQILEETPRFRLTGKVRSCRGVLVTCQLPAAVGDQCVIRTNQGKELAGEVIGFSQDLAYLVLYRASDEVAPGMTVINRGHAFRVPSGRGLLGRVVDGLGDPIDGKGSLRDTVRRSVGAMVPPALERDRIHDVLVTGQRAIDGLLTCGRGQRIAIFAGSGVGKSTLLGEIAKNSSAQINVIALVGERGREVAPFLADCLGPVGLARSAVVVATSDQTPLMRVRAAWTAVAIAHSFRGQGKNVLLMVDSMTRLAMAQRELGLVLGEPPSARGYTPSVFQMLANYVECMGNDTKGSVTGLLTVLVDGDDLDEPVTDAVRGFVDGHIVLDRKLAEMHHYPAINIAKSISRVAHDLMLPAHREAARRARAVLASYAQFEDMIRLGLYVRGTDPGLDKAIEIRPLLLNFLKQNMSQPSPWPETMSQLEKLTAGWQM